ncbi:MAG: dihydrodipicolinate synthase family protein [bacterium]|nr:dihydrodipicolinate synthase family protein [bacterium]
MTELSPNLAGILPPLTTPFDERGEVDLDALARNVERYNETALAGYVALGSNGEAVHLTAAERRRVIATIRRAAAPGLTVVAGVNELSTRAAVEATRQAADAGADAVLVVTPYFYKSAMSQDVLRGFYLEVAAASPLPLVIYNVPQNTGVVIDPATIVALAAEERIVGVKDSSGNQGALSETIRLAPAGFSVLVGNAGILYPSLLMGARGGILAVACAAPAVLVELYDAARGGDHERARDLQRRMAPLASLVTAGLGVAGLKAALELAGYAGGAPRSPLCGVSGEDRERIASVMRESGLFADLPATSYSFQEKEFP